MPVRDPRKTPEDFVAGTASPPPTNPHKRAQLAADIAEARGQVGEGDGDERTTSLPEEE